MPMQINEQWECRRSPRAKRLAQTAAEGKTSYELSWGRRKKNDHESMLINKKPGTLTFVIFAFAIRQCAASTLITHKH